MYDLKIIYNKNIREITKRDILKFIDLDLLKKINEENIYSSNLYKPKCFNEVKFPLDIEQTKKVLEGIQESNFNIAAKYNNEFKNIQHSIIAEYMVNLFFAHKLKLTVTQFRKSCHTSMDINLIPLFTAKGGSPDFDWYDERKNIQYIIETTIHKTPNDVIKNESFTIMNHATSVLGKNSQNSKLKLFFINFLNFKTEKLKNDVELAFNSLFDSFLKDIKNKILYKLSFKELTYFNET
ncbi:hypothetical protein [Mycoplasma elephantis]|uniref:hypothetical protein n=1 Tax=Mycoplasma elephantis TaxID=114882 RepID=UPI0004898AA8|nr:hypothetical protein [Mycoplasma elephantis]